MEVVEAVMEVNYLLLLPVYFHLLPWKLVGISFGGDRMEFGGLLWNVFGSGWKFVILVESRWEYIGVYGRSWKPPVYRIWSRKLQLMGEKELPLPPSVKTSIYFRGSFQ